MTSLLPSVDPEQIMARLRTDGATWFVPDFGRTDENDDEAHDVDLTDDTDIVQVESAEHESPGDLNESIDVDTEYVDEDTDEDESDD